MKIYILIQTHHCVEKARLLLRASRPIFWPIGPLIFLGGAIYSHAQFSLPLLLPALLLSFPACLFAFGINDYYDYSSDRNNPRKKAAASAKERKFVKDASLAAGFAVILLSLLASNPASALLISLAILLGYAYSVPPLRLKEKPPLDSFANGAICLFLFLAGYSFGGDFLAVFPRSLFGLLCIAGFHAFSTIPDYPADKKAGHRTFAVAFGKRSAALFALSCVLAAYLFSGVQVASVRLPLLLCAALFAAVSIFPDERLAKVVSFAVYALFIAASVLFLAGFAGVALRI